MLTLALCAQLAAATPVDSTYATAALREVVARAAIQNRYPPPALKAYRSRIETELSLLIRDTLGRERSAEVEQLATDATWTRGDRYDLRIVGYRAQNIGVPYSILSIVRAWTVPTLYGDRLSLGAYFSRSRRNDTLVAVHPFSSDRDRFYRFSGGDTVATLRAGSRTIPIVRIHVHPDFRGNTRLGAFDGEIDLDADRAQIVRMRGRLVVIGGRSANATTSGQRFGVVAAAYIEFVNAEIDGTYWLPTFQRTEFQANFPLLGQTRPVFRLVSTIGSIAVTEAAVTEADAVASDVSVPRVVVSWAPSDSVSAFRGWAREIGALTTSVHADDFNDIAPDAWKSSGRPRIDLFPSTLSRVVRFNRVEGFFTGVAPSVNFRSVVPGLSAGVFGGWAWSEQTARGGAFVSLRRANAIYGIRTERSLASTNDFEPPFADDPGLGALFSSLDNFDYVDRRSASMSVARILGTLDRGLASVQVGVVSDRAERTRITRGLFGEDDFRMNRGVDEGTSMAASAVVELHPNVTGEFVQPGVGARAFFEAGRGDLDWTRSELELIARRYFGPLSLVAQAQAGIVEGNSPPSQRLFELGGDQSLPGYDYKEFVGNRAALFRLFTSYRFQIWQRPRRVWRNFLMPGVSPGIAASVNGAWTELSSPGAVAAASRLTNGISPIPQPTNGARATVGGGLTFFSDMVHVGMARPVDRVARWRLVAGFGTAF